MTDTSETHPLAVENALLRGSLFLAARTLKDYHDTRHVKTDDPELLSLTVPESLRQRAAEAVARADKLLRDEGRQR